MPDSKSRTGSTQRAAMPARLEDLPNIGKKLATDLRSAGIREPLDLMRKDPRVLFEELVPVMGHRHDPFVFYTLLAVRHYLQHAEAWPWWKFTAQGRGMLEKG